MSEVIKKVPEALRKASISEKSGNIILPAGRMMFADLFQSAFPSKRERDPKKKRWGLNLLIPDGFDLSVLEQEVERIVAENLTDAKRKPLGDGSLPYNVPIIKTGKVSSLASYADEYPTVLRPGAKEFTNDGKQRPRPEVVDAKGVAIDESRDPEECYNGRWCRLSVNPFWYPAYDGKPGVSLGLVNAQLLWHDDPLAGGKAKASSDFEAVDGVDLEDMGELNEDAFA